MTLSTCSQAFFATDDVNCRCQRSKALAFIMTQHKQTSFWTQPYDTNPQTYYYLSQTQNFPIRRHQQPFVHQSLPKALNLALKMLSWWKIELQWLTQTISSSLEQIFTLMKVIAEFPLIAMRPDTKCDRCICTRADWQQPFSSLYFLGNTQRLSQVLLSTPATQRRFKITSRLMLSNTDTT